MRNASGGVFQDTQPLTALPQPFDEVAADEAAAAGDESGLRHGHLPNCRSRARVFLYLDNKMTPCPAPRRKRVLENSHVLPRTILSVALCVLHGRGQPGPRSRGRGGKTRDAAAPSSGKPEVFSLSRPTAGAPDG